MSPDSSPENKKLTEDQGTLKKNKKVLNQISAGNVTTLPGGDPFSSRYLIEHVQELSRQCVWGAHTWGCRDESTPGNLINF